MKNFLVYKSSAGSGKTTTLVKEYLKLTLKNPALFRKILAITFTNKAANEMKTRILEALQRIISGRYNDNGVISGIIQEAGLDGKSAAERAKELLFNIEHHYEDFSVSTIDSFVHKVVRTFAAELELPQNFETVIDESDFVPFIVEDVYQRVGRDKDFTTILTRFVLSKVEDEKSHKINDTLSGFVKEQLKEQNYFAAKSLDTLTTADFITVIKNVSATLAQLKATVTAKGKEAFTLVENVGLSFDDFKGKKSRSPVHSFFKKAAQFNKIQELTPDGINKTTRETFIDDTGWYTKTTPGAIIEKIESVKEPLKGLFNEISALAGQYLTYRLIFDNIFQVALTREIRALIRLFIERTQKVHISEFNKQIAKKIAGEPVPFIYERLGVRYTHFMIDEFQDTSLLQWSNLLPLIHESLAGNHFNMLVGDAKQAIYRFRGGEVELFTHLPLLYGLEKTENMRDAERALTDNFVTKPLDTNYRSRAEIIRFNNDFFNYAKAGLPGDLKKIYENHQQKPSVHTGKGGFVSLHLIDAGSAEEYGRNKELEILEIIRELHKKGYPYGKITVLSRKNKDSSSMAAVLLSNNIPVVSSESIKLAVSPKVRFLVSLLHYLLHPDNEVNNANLLYLFLKNRGKEGEFHRLLLHKEDPARVMRQDGFPLPSAVNPLLSRVYEMTSELVRIFYGREPVDLFVRFFLDFVYDTGNLHLGDIGAFLKLWEEKRETLSISLPEGTDAVQLMTAHKAKGLKFGTVIVDLEYNPGKDNGKIWQKVDLAPLRPLTEALFDLNRNLTYIGKEELYEREQAKKQLDFLNLIYVAFTRPVDALFAVGRKKGKTFGSYLEGYLQSKGVPEDEQERYELGEFPQPEKEEVSQKQTVGISLTAAESKPWGNLLAVAAPERNPLADTLLNEVEYGNLLHELMAGIKDSSYLEREIKALEKKEEATGAVLDRLRFHAERILAHNELKPYFQPGVKAFTETEVYDPESGMLLRPDRVVLRDKNITVIDYKTGAPGTEHRRQIARYGRFFERAGYSVEKMLLVYAGNKVDVVEVS